MSDQTYDAIHLTAKPGTRIVVQSDGLTESFGDADDVLPSLERLGLLNGAVTSPVLEQRVQALFTTDQPDDATLLVLDFQP
jgi:serine phosphatase RsbU (regulator of sigma subunit)